MYSSYFNSITSKVTSIRQNIFQGEADGDTEDDTYLCRVMRTYYLQEKKQNLPAWLPPDPRGPHPSPVVQPVYSQPVGSTYGQAPPAAGGSQGLNSLFGGATGRTNAPSPPPGSLRAARATGGPARSQSPFATQGASATGSLSARDRLKMGRSKGSAINTNVSAMGDASYDSGYENRFASQDGGEKPFMAATSPWASNAAEFGGGGYEPPRRGVGLPSGGPAAGRRPGLPSGPRSGR
ncbi:hypothetical protein sscle_14g099440 [Sclerotinia sclerotiorum 1980 UF-70]|uniref:Mso1 N-terminal domain-containing protein n=1 Tax=Sclerotinia sclerotiorum (strain ATCC 18683 / 1980 / Ss-1) TaxID=665079 RepID=A0A1D9QJR1_SCLS1|nr:hypothetical protein sscle_14g099440 [Sclerotinia sclerotiorum 1980 UF-70]